MTFEAQRNELGHFTEKPEAIKQYSFTSANAADMARRRWEKYRQQAADAITEEMGSIAPGVTTPEAAWGVLNARLATQIMDSDKPRGDDLQLLGQNMGAIPTAYERTEMENQPPPMPSGAVEALALVAGTFAQVMRDVMHLHEQPQPTIEGLVLDTDISGSNNVRIGEQDNTPSSTPIDADPKADAPANEVSDGESE